MPAAPHESSHEALVDALVAVLRPLARLAVARGLPFGTAEELLKRVFVQAAREAQPEPAASRIVSRVSTATGINRREVTRLLEQEMHRPPKPRSLAAEVFARWSTAREYRDRRGVPRALPRQGADPSFEALAQSITRDVHPRSLLDELVRLGRAEHDAATDTVKLQRRTFVPRRDAVRMLGFLGDNVGDHLASAVHNVLVDGPDHFEQAVFADELSFESIAKARAVVHAQWQSLIDTLVPMLEQMMASDRDSGRVCDQRLRVGLFTFHEPIDAAPGAPHAPRARRPRKETT
jgi:hypothetical protein